MCDNFKSSNEAWHLRIQMKKPYVRKVSDGSDCRDVDQVTMMEGQELSLISTTEYTDNERDNAHD